MNERLLKILKVLATQNPFTTFQNMIRLRPKMISLLSIGTLILSYLSWKFGIMIPPNILPQVSMIATAFSLGVLYEYKRLLPFNVLSNQNFLKKTANILIGEHGNQEDITFKYHDRFPVCTIKTTSSYERGRLIAQNFAPQIVDSFDQYYNWLPTAIDLIYTGTSLAKTYKLPHHDPKSPLFKTDIETYLQSTFEKMQFKFPDHIIEEFRGIMDVIQPYIINLNKNTLVDRHIPNIDTIKLLVALPDMVKMSPFEILGVNCTAAIRKLPGGVQHMRTLDYASLGTLTEFTALYTWLSPNSQHTQYMPLASVAFVPFAAALSITNGYLTATINDAGTTMTKRFEEGGVPETLCLRYALENCRTFEELDQHFLLHYPSSTCSFAISNKTGGRVYQMLPTEHDRYYSIRPLSDKGAVVVTNHHYLSHSEDYVGTTANRHSINWHTTFDRKRTAIDAIENGKTWDEVLRSVNVPDTAQSMCFQYPNESSSGKSLVLKLSVKNYNAADCTAEEYRTIPVGELLEDLQRSCRNSIG